MTDRDKIIDRYSKIGCFIDIDSLILVSKVDRAFMFTHL